MAVRRETFAEIQVSKEKPDIDRAYFVVQEGAKEKDADWPAS